LQWICGIPKSVYAKVAYGFRRDIAVEDEVTALIDYGEGATGVFVTATHDLVGTDRFEILGDNGKIVVDSSKTATVSRLSKPEREISESMDMQDVMSLFTGRLNTDDYYSSEVIEFESAWGGQHAGVLENFAANILDGTPLIAPGSDGINGVRLANAIHSRAGPAPRFRWTSMRIRTWPNSTGGSAPGASLPRGDFRTHRPSSPVEEPLCYVRSW
jgi:predicted dehydrogenase